ncbi:MAG: type II secretion system protein [Candidatus Latescibacteria bacterium]|nr:type II secretion system protein [Candidatus Latescibacterota bacterium]
MQKKLIGINRPRFRNNEKGMTIAELLVAMTIGSILAVLMFQFMADQVTRFSVKRQESEMQQELRWAMNFLYDHVRLAGNGVPPTSGWAVIEAVDGVDDSPDSLTIMGSFKAVTVTTTQNMASEGDQIKCNSTDEIETGDLCVISDGTFTEIFIVTNKNSTTLWHDASLPWNDDNQLDHVYNTGSSIQVVTHLTFYVDTDDEGRINLMLKHQAYDPQILLGDVEDFQIRFNMKDGSWITEPEPDEIYDIREIEMTLRSKTSEPIPNYIDPVYGDGYRRVEIKGLVIPQNIVII